MVKEQLTALIEAKRAHVGVVGLGYVGLPLLTEFARAGFQATGFEVDAVKAAQINSGEDIPNPARPRPAVRSGASCGPGRPSHVLLPIIPPAR